MHFIPTFRSSKLLRRVLAVALGWWVVASLTVAAAGADVSELPAEDRFALMDGKSAAAIHVAEGDWEVAKIAARDLAADVERVTGMRPALISATDVLPADVVVVGTVGRSERIDALIAAGKLDVRGIAGQWETFVIEMIRDPWPGVERALVIAGSDRRGTAYGVYELSRRIGVSPWYWWADVTPRKRQALHVAATRMTLGPPTVKYRGIFINDEMWGIRTWAEGNFAPAEGRGLGPKTHAKIFELLLRLRANHFWPAMHRGTIPFNTYPANKQVADDYAIVMGSSHIEPMLRNNMHGAEWDREGGGEWNYATNRSEILDYWERRVAENGRFENLYTLGMRGKDDEPMPGGFSQARQIELLQGIFADQRAILARHVDADPARVPQVFIPYTEVLGLYDAGLQVPDDVTICWPDDNFGYIRRLPTARERRRSGGSGIYYHIQWLNGATSAYTWLNTMPLALMSTQMTQAWQSGADRLWVLNVGDIKPGEIGMEYFLDMAWNPELRQPDAVREFLTEWAARDLAPESAAAVADILMEYFQLGFTRRPEHLVQFEEGKPLQYSWFTHDAFHDEAGRRLERYAEIARRARAIYETMPDERADAFFQLVLYPVECAWLMNEKIIRADLNARHAAEGLATARGHAQAARAAAERILDLTEEYNTGLRVAGDKWRHMMSCAPGPWGNQRHQFDMPPLSDWDGIGPPALHVAPEGGVAGAVDDLSVFTQGRRFVDLSNTGKGSIRWKARVSHPWLKLDAMEGEYTTGARVWVSADWDAVPTGETVDASIHIESDAGSARVAVPLFNPSHPRREEITGYVESHGTVSMEAEHFSRRHDRDGAGWRVVDGLGRSGGSVVVFPATVESRTTAEEIRAHAPALEYEFHVFQSGTCELHVDCLPTYGVAPGQGARVAVSLDDSDPVVLDHEAKDIPVGKLANLRRWTTQVSIEEPGKHTLTVCMVDPGVILDRIALHTRRPRASYLGPPESFRGYGK